MLDLVRCQLSTQSIRSDAKSGKATTINVTSGVDRLSTLCIHWNTISSKASTIHADYPFERYVWCGVHYVRKVSLLLPSKRRKEKILSFHAADLFERYIWHGIYYARKVSLLLPSEHRKEKVLSSPHSRSV